MIWSWQCILHAIFFQKTIVFPKTTVFMEFVVSLTIVNDEPSLTILNIIVNNFFLSKTIVFSKAIVFKKNNHIKNSRKSFFFKTIIFKNNRHSFSKSSTSWSFLKTIVLLLPSRLHWHPVVSPAGSLHNLMPSSWHILCISCEYLANYKLSLAISARSSSR